MGDPNERWDATQASEIRAEWNAVAEDWNDAATWRRIERGAQSVNDRLVELAALGPGDRVLDVGTGIGEPAVTAARHVGPGGRVLGIDLSDRMIDEARSRVARLGLPQVRFEVADAARLERDLDLTEGSFDAVLSRWMLMLLPDLRTVLADLCRLLRPGGRLAVGLWGHPDRVPLIQTAFAAAASLMPAPPPDAGEPARHLWTDGAQALADVARRAGYEDVRTESVPVANHFSSPRDYADFIARVAGPVRVLKEHLAGRDPDGAERLLAALEEQAKPLCGPGGDLLLISETLILTGSRPAS